VKRETRSTFTFHVSRFTSGPRLILGAALCLPAAIPPPAGAQETGTSVYHSPYRSFLRYEFGVAASFQRGSQTGIEGHYRRGVGPVDLAVRAGRMIRDDVQDSFLVGVQGRVPFLSEEQSPLRGALVVGAGLDVSGGVSLWVPVGLSLGRRLVVEQSAVRLVPFVQPTVYFTSVGSGVEAGLGLGLDLRLSPAFEFRVSGGFGTAGAPDGVGVSAVWLR
jgi:hypothetical protein